MERVIFCLFLPKDIKIYEEQMQKFFPPQTSAAKGEETKGKEDEGDQRKTKEPEDKEQEEKPKV